MPAFAAADLEVFRDVVVRRIGLQLDASKLGLLAEVFEQRLDESRQPAAHYLAHVNDPQASRNELRRIAEALTVPETYFLRHFEQFRAFMEVAVREAQARRANERQLRILSAGCASGEESYSLAMMTAADILPGWNVTIDGVDINCAMLARAARGRYSMWSLREAPPELQRRWFHNDGQQVVIDAALRDRVRFLEHNLALAEEESDAWMPGSYDVVFCRNVIMYFTPDRARRVVARLARALPAGGHLFLGSAETLRGLSDDFDLRHSHGAFYYQRRPRAGAGAAPATTTPTSTESDRPVVDWQESVQRSSDRIVALSLREGGAAAGLGEGGGATSLAEASPPPARALELLRRERFADALAILDALTPEQMRAGDVLLMRAVLLVHLGQVDPAEAIAADLLGDRDHAAAAHHVLARCREAAGDTPNAYRQDHAAVASDPSFAMPHLHLGLLARRQGDVDVARVELRQALALLGGERTSRLLLFGGGFARETLIALCQGELARLEGTNAAS